MIKERESLLFENVSVKYVREIIENWSIKWKKGKL